MLAAFSNYNPSADAFGIATLFLSFFFLSFLFSLPPFFLTSSVLDNGEGVVSAIA